MTQNLAEVKNVVTTAFGICDNCERTYPSDYTLCTQCGGRLRREGMAVSAQSTEQPTLPIEHIWTLERQVDELFLHLWIVEELHGGSTYVRRYQAQAHDLMYKIPIYRPVPAFIINLGDLPEYLVKKLEDCNKRGQEYVIKSAVGRIFEALNLEYFALSVARSLVVRLER
jgi:hypothetical protein